ncbi:MAG: orotate phosphoribosyltransferase-like protein [Candidatus Bathyarchaeia archaeon]
MASNELVKRTQELKSKGLSTYEIADELKVQPDTVVWLLLRGKERAARHPPRDVFVDWSSLGSHGKRMTAVASALADLIRESVRAGEFDEPDVIVAIEGSGMVLGVAIAKELDKPFAAVRPHRVAHKKLPGLVNPSFHKVAGKKVLIADAVLRAGETHRAAIQTLRKAKAKPVGILVLVNKSGKPKIDGVPLKSLIQILPVAPP